MTNYFNKKRSILTSSESALNLFVKATEALQKVSDKSKRLITENEAKITNLQVDNQQLITNAERSDKIIGNINKLLEL